MLSAAGRGPTYHFRIAFTWVTPFPFQDTRHLAPRKHSLARTTTLYDSSLYVMVVERAGGAWVVFEDTSFQRRQTRVRAHAINRRRVRCLKGQEKQGTAGGSRDAYGWRELSLTLIAQGKWTETLHSRTLQPIEAPLLSGGRIPLFSQILQIKARARMFSWRCRGSMSGVDEGGRLGAHGRIGQTQRGGGSVV